MNRDFIGALLQLNAEKNIPREQLVATLADAIQSAYRRSTPGNENVYVDVDSDSGKFNAYRAMVVVDEIEDDLTEYTVEDAKKHDPNAKVGDLIRIGDLDASSFGRIHAQMATQLVRQRLREVEREQVFGQYAQRESEIITGTVSRVEPRGVILDVGRAEAILPTTDQSATEHYRIGQHVKAYVLEVRRTTKGPLIYVSRTHKNFLRRLFELEVPEIHGGAVEIKAIAREAGSRSKVGVASRQEGLDPVGATVGQRGGRVQAVVAELGGEKIDIIPWNEDPAVFVANALSPATVVSVTIDEENRIANVTVPERMLSLAIGREGQNARLAAKLTGWRIDIRSDQAQARPAAPPPDAPAQAAAGEALESMPEQPADSAAEAPKPKKARAKAAAEVESEPVSEPADKPAAKKVAAKAAVSTEKKASTAAAKKSAATAARTTSVAKAVPVKPAAKPAAAKAATKTTPVAKAVPVKPAAKPAAAKAATKATPVAKAAPAKPAAKPAAAKAATKTTRKATVAAASKGDS